MVYSRPVQEALMIANAIARSKESIFIECAHLALGFVSVEECAAGNILKNHGINVQAIPKQDISINVPFSPALEKAMTSAKDLAVSYGSDEVGSEHILYAMLSDNDSYLRIALENKSINVNALLDELFSVMSFGVYDEAPASQSELEKYGRCLTKAAAQGKLDAIFGRDAEIERMIAVLLRKNKSCPCLVGDAGVGKTAVVEGLAIRIADGCVPDAMKGINIYSVDVSSVVAGTKYRGDFEERLQTILDLCFDEGAVLFFDEIHTIIGTGAPEGALDAANILKPYLARSGTRIIGATTYSEFRRRIERDPALKRRFCAIEIKEPSVSETILILEAIRPKYEAHHRIRIRPEALRAAAEYSERYLSELYLPDKAIDLIDEACAKNAAKRRSSTTALDIKKLISEKTLIPLNEIGSAADKRIIKLEKLLNSKIVAQDEAIAKVVSTIRSSFWSERDKRGPMASFIFAGPTGVGKTELAKLIAQAMFDSKDSFVRFDMSEFMDKSSHTKLIGSPPGYVGYGEGGNLTDAVARHPYSLILFDEAEKADHAVFDLFLQLLDEGSLTDSLGRKVDFSNCFVVFTTNLGVDTHESNKRSVGFSDTALKADTDNERYDKALRSAFRPEFLNRIDEVVIFREFEEEDVARIIKRRLAELKRDLKKKGISFAFSSDVVKKIARECDFVSYGAREVTRAIRRAIEEPLFELLSKVDYSDLMVKAVVWGGKIIIKVIEEMIKDK